MGWLSFALMTLGTFLAAWAMLAGKASVLYTFYPPLKAHPFFYLGAALLIIGSWIPLYDWARMYVEWKNENKETKTPLAVLGTLVNFTIWFVCTLAVAYEVLVLLLPWAMGWKATVNVTLARTLFWFFGHALVYFWLLPSYVMFYTILPKVAGGKLFSDLAGRIAFFGFLILSIPIGIHHHHFVFPFARADPTAFLVLHFKIKDLASFRLVNRQRCKVFFYQLPSGKEQNRYQHNGCHEEPYRAVTTHSFTTAIGFSTFSGAAASL